METIAIYWEKQVKVYGIMLKSNLILSHLKLGKDADLPWHNLLTQVDRLPVNFELITSMSDKDGSPLLLVVLDSEQHETFEKGLKDRETKLQTTFPLHKKNIELIYLHGPHFQERFGILARALEPLYKESIETIVTGCAGNSMYIGVPDGQGTKATAILKSTFQTPSSL